MTLVKEHFKRIEEVNGSRVRVLTAFAPLGPFMATTDEIENVNDMRMWLNVNGDNMQEGNTSNLILWC